MENCSRVFYTMGMHPEFDQRVIGWVNGLRRRAVAHGAQPPQEFVALDHLLHDMRLFKSRAELDTMRAVGPIAVARAHAGDALRPARPHGIRGHGGAAARVPPHNADISYHPIVGGGANACILHYHENVGRAEATATCC